MRRGKKRKQDSPFTLMLGVVVSERPRGTKHLLCKDADTELVFICRRIEAIRQAISKSGFHLLGFGPIDKAGNIVPTLPLPVPMIQERMDAFEETLLRLGCYMAVRGSRTMGIPDVDEEGRQWLKGLRKQFRLVREAFEGLKEDVVNHMASLLTAVGLDVAKNESFSLKFQGTLTEAIHCVLGSLPPSPNPKLRAEQGAAFIKRRCKEYASLKPMERLLPDAGSLGELALAHKLAQLFEINLKRWDRTHGIRLPRLRRVFEVLAYDLVPHVEQGKYDLRALFWQ